MTDADEDDRAVRANGGCECGAVRYRVRGPLRDVVSCHCGQCRRTHGHFAAYTATRDDHLEMVETRGLKWFDTSTRARRGFCGECGGRLFWKSHDRDSTNIAAGTLDAPTGLKTVMHIHAVDKSDYYDIPDGVPVHQGTIAGLERIS
jgi:hypothetical protein